MAARSSTGLYPSRRGLSRFYERRADDELARSSEPEELPREGSAALPRRRHCFDVGQPVSYGGDDKPDIGERGHGIAEPANRNMRLGIRTSCEEAAGFDVG